MFSKSFFLLHGDRFAVETDPIGWRRNEPPDIAVGCVRLFRVLGSRLAVRWLTVCSLPFWKMDQEEWKLDKRHSDYLTIPCRRVL